jgi:hypothetical protein
MTAPPQSQSRLAVRLLGDHKDRSSSSTGTGTITVMAQSADASASTTTNLFPTTTAGRGDSIAGPGSANVYYLVVSLYLIIHKAAALALHKDKRHRSDTW